MNILNTKTNNLNNKKKIVFSLDLEDHTGKYIEHGRYIKNVNIWLEFLEKLGIRGTFFVVGAAAKNNSKLIKKIFKKGHEIASHSYLHIELKRQSAKLFLESEKKNKDLLEQIIGQKIYGFRAPVFSLTPKTTWAVEILGELGYLYSSSTIPCRNPLNGFPGLLRDPFKWENGVIEFPCPVFSFGDLAIPFLGGVYLRYIPAAMLKMLIKKHDTPVLWTYIHPYDIDSSETYVKFANSGLLTNLLLWSNRKNCLRKIEKILSPNIKTRFVDLLETVAFGTLYKKKL